MSDEPRPNCHCHGQPMILWSRGRFQCSIVERRRNVYKELWSRKHRMLAKEAKLENLAIQLLSHGG